MRRSPGSPQRRCRGRGAALGSAEGPAPAAVNTDTWFPGTSGNPRSLPGQSRPRLWPQGRTLHPTAVPPRGSAAGPAGAAPAPGRPGGKVPAALQGGQSPSRARSVPQTGPGHGGGDSRELGTAKGSGYPSTDSPPCPQRPRVRPSSARGPAGARSGAPGPAPHSPRSAPAVPRSALASGPRTARLRLWAGTAGTAGLPSGRFAGCALQEGAESSYFLPKCQVPARDSLPPSAGSLLCQGCLRPGSGAGTLCPRPLAPPRAGTASVLSTQWH